MAGPQSLAEQVSDRIAKVQGARSDAIVTLKGRFWQSEATKQALSVLERDAIGVGGWSQRGTDALAAGKEPAGAGWPGWIKAGDILLDGIADQVGEAEHATLENITQTVADVKADVARVASKAAKTAKAVGAVAGDVAGAATKPLLPVLGIAAVGLVALAALKFGGGRK